jgi:hypothetical protein
MNGTGVVPFIGQRDTPASWNSFFVRHTTLYINSNGRRHESRRPPPASMEEPRDGRPLLVCTDDLPVNAILQLTRAGLNLSLDFAERGVDISLTKWASS